MAARLYRTRAEKGKKGESGMFRTILRTGDQLEEYCLGLFLRYPELWDKAGSLSPEHFDRSENREVFIACQSSSELQTIRQNLDASLHEHLQTLVSKEQPPADKSEQERELSHCIRRLEERKLRVRLVFEAESAMEMGENSEQGSARLTELQHKRITSGWQ